MTGSTFTGDLEDEKWLAWYRLTPQERWRETERLWQLYLEAGGSLEPERDPQSPFDSFLFPDQAPEDVEPDAVVLGRGMM